MSCVRMWTTRTRIEDLEPGSVFWRICFSILNTLNPNPGTLNNQYATTHQHPQPYAAKKQMRVVEDLARLISFHAAKRDATHFMLLPALHCEPCTVNPTPHTLHLIPYTLHPKSYTLHLTPYTLHSTLYTVHPPPYT